MEYRACQFQAPTTLHPETDASVGFGGLEARMDVAVKRKIYVPAEGSDLNIRLTAKLLMALASTVILGSETHRTHAHILLSDGSGSLQTLQMRSSLNLPARNLVNILTDRAQLPHGICRNELLNSTIFWDVTPCSLVDFHRSFR
jgi:hypothetical protein